MNILSSLEYKNKEFVTKVREKDSRDKCSLVRRMRASISKNIKHNYEKISKTVFPDVKSIFHTQKDKRIFAVFIR